MKKFLVLLLAFSMILCLGACGEKISDNDKNDKIEEQEDDVTVKIEEIENVEEIDDDKESEKYDDKQKPKKTITVGYTIYEPMSYKNEYGELVGFDTELAQEVFSNLDYEVEFKEIDWGEKYIELDSGSIDCVWNGFASNAADDDGIARSEKVDFSYNYMENYQVVVVKKRSGINSEGDLNDKVGCVQSRTMGEWYAEILGAEELIRVIEQTDCITQVEVGGADFAVVDAGLAKEYVGNGNYTDLEIAESLSSEPEYYAVAFKKGSDLTAKVNEQLEALAADGTIDKIAEKYELEYLVITDFSDQR